MMGETKIRNAVESYYRRIAWNPSQRGIVRQGFVDHQADPNAKNRHAGTHGHGGFGAARRNLWDVGRWISIHYPWLTEDSLWENMTKWPRVYDGK